MSSAKIENLGDNKVKLTINIPADKFEEGIEKAYNKAKGSIQIQGFRKGKAPRKIIESQYGSGIFHEDAINFSLPEFYELALSELEEDVVSRPEINIVEISEENGVTVEALVYVKPEVKLGDYTSIKVDKYDTSVSEEDITVVIDNDREKNSRIISVSDRAVKDGDIVTIDFEGFKDGVPFDGGKGEDYDLTIGSKSFVDTFEEQLIDKLIDEEVEVNVTFPEEYASEDLKGQDAQFKVKIKEIKTKELPELNDEFAADVSEFDTLEAYKDSIREKLLKVKESEAVRDKENKVMEALIAATEIDVPLVMIENQIETLIRDFENQLKSQGIGMDMYLEYMGQSIATMREAYKMTADKQVRGRLILEAIAKAENFEVSEEDINKELQRIADAYGMELSQLQNVVRDEDKEGIVRDLQTQKALEYIIENALAE